MDEWWKLLITFISGLGSGMLIIIFREWIVNILTSRKNRKKSYELAKIFLHRELEDNFQQYVSRSGESKLTLQSVFEIDEDGIAALGDFTISIFNKNFSNSAWLDVKSKIVEMNFDLAKEISAVYDVFEYMKNNNHTQFELLDLTKFEGFSNRYAKLYDKINVK